MSTYTASGARRGGDQYQDLQSASIILDWLEHPNAYQWIRLEAMEGSLDDIQACDEHGVLTLLQIKFGLDATKEWTWKELTDRGLSRRKPKGGEESTFKRSLIMKWAESLSNAGDPETIKEAGLITNRKCSRQIRVAILDDERIDFTKLSTSVRNLLSTQLGGETRAIAFFNKFTFRFHDTSPDILEEGLYARFCRNGGIQSGWFGLLDGIKRWINLQHEPGPDGRILLHHIRAAAQWHQPSQIPQGFVIPEDFVPPQQWSTQDVEPVLLGDSPQKIVVITGSPGIGKSTYLSWLVNDLTKRQIPVIRHHFFLSTSDITQRRNAWETAADSLIGQLRANYPQLTGGVTENPTPDKLRKVIEEAASAHARDNTTPLVVMVDGLDHVWRDTGKNDDLMTLFDMLLPVSEGVRLVVGTQSIDAERLPLKLTRDAPPSTWLEVPLFDLERTHAWLQHHRKELDLPSELDFAQRTLAEIAEALGEVSGGHPLVLHYIHSSARLRGSRLSTDGIRAAVRYQPGSSIAAYYQELWGRLDANGQALLHMLAGFPWAWPEEGLVQCLTQNSNATALDEAERSVRHLLGNTHAGITAFHESLLVFIRSQPDHATHVHARRPVVRLWLDESAPPFWRWRHSMEEASKAGEPEYLISGPTREWCINALVSGYDINDIRSIVSSSGKVALANGRLGEATERRLLHDNLGEAEYTPDVIAGLRSLALRLVDAQSLEANLHLVLANAATLSAHECRDIAEVARIAEYVEVCQLLAKECKARWNNANRSADHYSETHRTLEIAFPMIIGCAIQDGRPSPYRRAHSDGHDDPDFCRVGDYADVLEMLSREGGETRAVRDELRFIANLDGFPGELASDNIVRLACFDGFDPKEWFERSDISHGELYRVYKAIVQKQITELETRQTAIAFGDVWSTDYGNREAAFRELARKHFFSCISLRDAPIPLDVHVEAEEARRILNVLADIASEAAVEIGQESIVNGAWFLRRLSEVELPNVPLHHRHDFVVGREPISKLVISIALDLELIAKGAGYASSLTAEILIESIEGHWTNARLWIDAIVSQRKALPQPQAAIALMQRERERLRISRDHLHLRAEQYITLAHFAFLHGCSLADVVALMKLSAQNVLGHGFHKDITLLDTLNAVVQAHTERSKTLSRIAQLTPLVRCISDITDGDHTNDLAGDFGIVLSDIVPESLPVWIRTIQHDAEHWLVERCMTHLASTMLFQSAYERALGSTLLHEKGLVALDARRKQGDLPAGQVLETTLMYLGRKEAPHQKDEGTSESDERRNGAKDVIDVKEYPPERLEEFVAAMRNKGGYRDEAAPAWTTYWIGVAPQQTLDALNTYCERDGFPLERHTAQEVVALARQWEGKSSSLRWLIRYHHSVYGWNPYSYALSDVEWIWKKVAEDHQDKWLEFIIETSTPKWTSKPIAPVWGTERMIRYLNTVGQEQLAEEVTDSAVRFVSGLGADMVLPLSGLASTQTDVSSTLQLLVDRLDCPSRLVQQRAAWAISLLLSQEAIRSEVVETLLAWHSRERHEIRSSTLLLVFIGAIRHHGLDLVQASTILQSAHLVDTTAVKQLLDVSGIAASDIRLTAIGERATVTDASVDPYEFTQVVKAHLSPFFPQMAHTLDKQGLYFSTQWRAEATFQAHEQGMSLKPNFYFDFHYRGGRSDPLLNLHDRLSTLLRCSFLRVVERMSSENLIERSTQLYLACTVGILLDPELWGVQPAPRPGWWPNSSDLTLLTKTIVSLVQPRLDDEAEPVLAYACGPIESDGSSTVWLEIRGFLQAPFGMDRPSSAEFTAIPNILCEPSGEGISVTGTYEPTSPYGGPISDWNVAPLAWKMVSACRSWLQPDRESCGLYVPPTWLVASLVVETRDTLVVASSNGRLIGSYRYWNDELNERYYPGSPPRVGGALLIERQVVQRQIDRGATLLWVLTLKEAIRKEDAGTFENSNIPATYVIGGTSIIRADRWQIPELLT